MAESNREEIAKLESLYANNPGGRVFTHLAEAYRKAGELDRARQILEDGITRHAEYASAHVVLGRVLQDQGARAEASAAFRRVLELDPENRVALRSLGDLARDGDQREEALAYFRQLLSLDPTDDQLVRIIDQLNTAIHAADAEPLPTLESEPAADANAVAGSSGTQEPDFAEATPGSGSSRTEELPSSESEPALKPITADSEFRSGDAEPASAAEDEPFRVESFEGVDPAEFHVDASAVGGEGPLSPPVEDADLGEYVTPDISLDWDSEGLPHGEEIAHGEATALPGDLAAFAAAGSGGEDAGSLDVTPNEVTAASGLETGGPTPADEVETESRDAESEEVGQDADATEDAISAVGGFVDLGEEEVSGDEEPTFEEMLSSTATAWKLPEPEPAGLQAELQTETLAELYLSQGFNDRAAEVFRSLLERNPGDERLQRRLADVEAILGETGAPSDAGEDADTLDSFWTGGGQPESVEPTLYAWTETEEPAGPSIGAFFGEMLSWRPGTGNGHAPTAVPTGASAPESPSAEAPAPPEVTAAPEAPSAFAEVAAPAKEGGEPDTAFQEVATGARGPGESAFEEVAPPKDRQSFVAQESAAPLSTSSMLSQFSAPLNEVEAAFEEWFSGVPPQPTSSAEPAAPAAAPPVAQAKPEPAPAKPEPTPAAPAPSAGSRPSAAASTEESEDDEDLEMFRSWLQSLKR